MPGREEGTYSLVVREGLLEMMPVMKKRSCVRKDGLRGSRSKGLKWIELCMFEEQRKEGEHVEEGWIHVT